MQVDDQNDRAESTAAEQDLFPEHPFPNDAAAGKKTVIPISIPDAAKLFNMSESSLRWLRFCSEENRYNSKGEKIPVNGFAPAFVTLGRRVYIDPEVFLKIWRANGQSIALTPRVFCKTKP